MKMELYYSNYCEASKRISQLFRQYPQLQELFELRCVDKYYYQHKRFPDGVRGTPTIFKEENDRIKAYEGNSAFDLLKQMLKSQQKTVPPSDIPVGARSEEHGMSMPANQQQTFASSSPADPVGTKKIEGAEVSSGGGVSIIKGMGPNPDWIDASKLPTDENAAKSMQNPFAVNVKDMKKNNEGDARKALAQMEKARATEDSGFKSQLAGGGKMVPRPNPFTEPIKRR